MKLWDKGQATDQKIEQFTVGKDRELDVLLAPFDIAGSLAHAIMLQEVGILTQNELDDLAKELKKLHKSAQKGAFSIEEGIEDVHSQVEYMLTQKLGETGKKIHTGRSRNDQVLLDLRLFTRHELAKIVQLTEKLFDTLLKLSEQHKNVLMPGYTHTQVAMPSSFGLWFGAFAESLTDDLQLLLAAYNITNQNPLGSAAGYGSSFPLNRTLTTQLMGFDDLNYNVVYAQMGRGKMEKSVAFALSSLGGTLGKLATDVCLYMSQNFGFVSLPDHLTTGSSIMPHKKNPDVFELIRGHSNRLQMLPQTIGMVTANLTTGYHRDLQLIKEDFLPALETVSVCLEITQYMLENMEMKDHLLEDVRYEYLFSVEAVNAEVKQGVPFREAYQKIGKAIENGEYVALRDIHHTHEGSIGNLCNDAICAKKDRILGQFPFKKVKEAMNKLLA